MLDLAEKMLYAKTMMQKVVTKRTLNDDQRQHDLAYWLSRPASERLAAVDQLRQLYYGRLPRLQRTARVVQQTSR